MIQQLGAVIPWGLATFLICSVAGMVCMAWQRNKQPAATPPKSQAVRVRRNPLPKVTDFSEEEWAKIAPFLAVRGVSAELEAMKQKREA